MQSNENTNRARRGCRVKLERLNDHKLFEYELFIPTGGHSLTDNPHDRELSDNYLNINSPLGRELFGKRVGDTALNYRIIEISETENAIAGEDPVIAKLRSMETNRLDIVNRLSKGEWLYGRFGSYEPLRVPAKKPQVQYITDFDEYCSCSFSVSNYDMVNSENYSAIIYISDSKADFLVTPIWRL